MSVVLTHVRHRVNAVSPPFHVTSCGQRFIAGGGPRDWAVHLPATARCESCYPREGRTIAEERP